MGAALSPMHEVSVVQGIRLSVCCWVSKFLQIHVLNTFLEVLANKFKFIMRSYNPGRAEWNDHDGLDRLQGNKVACTKVSCTKVSCNKEGGENNLTTNKHHQHEDEYL